MPGIFLRIISVSHRCSVQISLPIAGSRAQTATKMKVFLIENSIPIRIRLKATVEELGGSIVGEASAQEDVLAKIEKAKPHILLIDLSLVEGNGPAMLGRVRLAQPDIVIVVFTEYGSLQYQRVCILSGADFFIEKAADYLVLVRLLESLKGVICSSAGGRTSEA